jgi:hypothetical protein
MSTETTSLAPAPAPVSEKALVLPILLVLAQAKAQTLPGLSTAQIRDTITSRLVASPADLETTSSGEVRLERMVRNAISSHKALERAGLAETREGLTSITNAGERHLALAFVSAMRKDPNAPVDPDAVIDDEIEDLPPLPPLSEGDLVFPALMELAAAEEKGDGPVSTGQLLMGIRVNVPFGAADIERVGSGDIRVERLVRNLRSHKSLVSRGYATESEGGLEIAEDGWKYLVSTYVEMLQEHQPAPDFSLPVVRRKPKGL